MHTKLNFVGVLYLQKICCLSLNPQKDEISEGEKVQYILPDNSVVEVSCFVLLLSYFDDLLAIDRRLTLLLRCFL
jgi:hypothetical protein